MIPKKQTLLVAPPEGATPIASRRRSMNGETLETKQISDILIRRAGQRKTDYLIRVDDGTSHILKTIGQNPKYLVFYNDQPMATCGMNYVPLFNAEIEECVMRALHSIDMKPVETTYDQGYSHSEIGKPIDEVTVAYRERFPQDKNYKWRMTCVLEKNFDMPMGHLKQNDRFDWGIGVTNSYDLSEGIHVYMYMYRQVCKNGLYAWSVSGKQNFVHVEKELLHASILDKVTQGIATIVGEHGSFFTRLDEMSKVMPNREQMKLLMKRIGVRKYEAALLADRGVMVEFNKAEIKEVTLDNRINSEYDLLNAITSMSQNTNSMRRQFDLQTGLMEKILQARTIVPSL